MTRKKLTLYDRIARFLFASSTLFAYVSGVLLFGTLLFKVFLKALKI